MHRPTSGLIEGPAWQIRESTEHCEAVATEIDVKLRWLGEQARRGLSLLSGASKPLASGWFTICNRPPRVRRTIIAIYLASGAGASALTQIKL